MKPLRKEDIDQEIFDMYDYYVHGRMERRDFMDRLSTYAVGGVTVSMLMDYLMPKYTERQQLRSDDPRVSSDMIEYTSPKGAGTMKGLLAEPAGNTDKLPGIVVVHENRGLNPHIEDVTRRAALAGYIALGPDALTPLGGYPGTDDEGRTMQRERDRMEMLEDFIAGYQYLKDHPRCTGKVGVVGFCFGGWISNMMAVRLPDLDTAVPFYGGQPDAADVPQIQAPLLLQYAELDKRVNAGWPDYEAALKEHNKDYEAHIYPGVNHGFHNDTTPRYDDDAAQLAWQRTIAFFDKHLK